MSPIQLSLRLKSSFMGCNTNVVIALLHIRRGRDQDQHEKQDVSLARQRFRVEVASTA